ncbi:MAG: diguanylate cyclase [Deltaproteobacteria bacterium]|nr:diguanylate cyclase [Deltaproteobacteria bacterium]
MKIHQILVVDNDPIFLKLMTSFLQGLNYEVKTAFDGITALSVLKDFSPQVIFTDWIMQNIGGEKFCRILRNAPEYDDTYIVALSATAIETNINVKTLGINACVAKGPFKQTGESIKELLHAFENNKKQIEKTIGLENLYKRQVTQELLTIVKNKDIALDNIKEGILEITAKNKIVYANRFASEILFVPEYSLLSANINDVLGKPLDQKKDSTVYFINNKYVSVNIYPIKGLQKSSIVIIHDITEQKRYEEGLRESEERYRDLFEHSTDLIQCISADGRFLYVNDSWKKTLGYDDSEIDELNVFNLIKQDCIDECMEKFKRILSGEEIEHIETTFISKDGKEIILEGNVNCKFEDGLPVSTRGIFRDITKRKELEDKLHRLSITDEMTGLLNRRGFITMAEKQLNIAQRSKKKLYFLYADLDNLKKVNDTLGHQVGDELITKAAHLLNNTFRKSDIIGRLGGDEFSVLQVEIPQEADMRNTLSRLQENIKKLNADPDQNYELSLSIGSVEYDPTSQLTLDDLIRKADKLMYEEKKTKHQSQ